jgi:insertion element IS1 protein InsB
VTGEQLWDAVESPMIEHVTTDYWDPYEHFVPSEKHIQSKAETFTVEGYNSLFRHFLARLRRKTKCYSKSETMLEYSVMLLMAKRNGELEYILN